MIKRSTWRTRPLALASVVVLTTVLGGLAACGDDDDEAASPTSTRSAERDRRVGDRLEDQPGAMLEDVEAEVAQLEDFDQLLHRYGEQANPAGATNWQSIHELLEFVIRDADGMWSNAFREAGLPEPFVNYVFPAPGESVPSTCGASGDRSASYCPADDQIIVSQAVARDLWNGDLVGPDGQTIGYGGDFAPAFIVAHEMAHSIQSELNVLGNYPVPAQEKHADCLAGLWTRDAIDRYLLDPGDLEEGLAAAFVVGDSLFGHPDHHGTSQERMDAFTLGWSYGDFQACTDTYLG